jgi:hypothetical protein
MPNEYVAGWVLEAIWAICLREKYPAPAGMRSPDRPARNVDTIETTLYINK